MISMASDVKRGARIWVACFAGLVGADDGGRNRTFQTKASRSYSEITAVLDEALR
jgi:hypothetical protein